jgi:hypothetical protein
VLESLAVSWFLRYESLFSALEVEELAGTQAALPQHLDRRLELIERGCDFLQMVVRHTRELSQTSASHPEIGPAFNHSFEQRRQQVLRVQERGNCARTFLRKKSATYTMGYARRSSAAG